MIDMTAYLPEMKTGKALVDAMTILPEYDSNICNQNAATRLMALSDLYKIYIPSEMSVEIYNKLYLALLRSLQKKYTKIAIRQQKENHKAIHEQEYDSIIGGSDSFTIIGTSGIGKSSAISRAIALITENRIIEITDPYTKIIPCITVQCPWDSSVKGLLLEILRKVDEVLDSNYYANAVRARATTDMLIGSVSQVALNHVGMLIVDEIQNVCNSRNGKSLVGMLTQLINNSGISIAMVGTPESAVFFQQALQLARRSLGLKYGSMPYGDYFKTLCQTLFSYQYTTQSCCLSDGITEWLYEHSGGITSAVVSLVHDAQEIAIMNGKDAIDIDLLNSAYHNRMGMLHDYLQPYINSKSQTTALSKKKDAIQPIGCGDEIENQFLIAKAAMRSKCEGIDIVAALKDSFTIEEVAL